jgi:uncharacterized membrane protein (UPF0127 family)
MPSNETAKTKSAPKHFKGAWWGVASLFFLGVSAALTVFIATSSSAKTDNPAYVLKLGDDRDLEQAYKPVVSSKPRIYYLKAAVSPDQQQKGLSGTDSLEANHGMIFVEVSVAERCFWMKDMHYPLDIIWLDTDKKVVHIEKNLSPSTYPKAYCALAQYVIELKAGETDRNGMKQGQVLSF